MTAIPLGQQECPTPWSAWFAWKPVRLSGDQRRVWLHWVERREVWSAPWFARGLGYRLEYRQPAAPPPALPPHLR